MHKLFCTLIVVVSLGIAISSSGIKPETLDEVLHRNVRQAPPLQRLPLSIVREAEHRCAILDVKYKDPEKWRRAFAEAEAETQFSFYSFDYQIAPYTILNQTDIVKHDRVTQLR